MPKQIYMEDVNTITLESVDHIQKALGVYSITLTTDQEDELYEKINNLIERFSKVSDYRSYN